MFILGWVAAMALSTSKNHYPRFECLPEEVEHKIHEFLQIATVFALQGVSRTSHAQIRAALRERFQWDLVYNNEDRVAPHVSLNCVVKAQVKVRSITMVSYGRSGFISFKSSFS